ncbi:teneurin-m, partial [Trichonephila clavata]
MYHIRYPSQYRKNSLDILPRNSKSKRKIRASFLYADFIPSEKNIPMPRQDVSFLHFLEPGTWYFSIINDDSTSVGISFLPSLARDVPTSCPNNCHHHGNCHLGKCHCFPGYIGHDCADSVCPVHCSGNGRYVQGSCRCETGWKGTECNVPVTECEVNDCNNQGICVAGKCKCRPGYKGNHCEGVDCLDPFCAGHGACVNGQCWCKTGWRGVNCSEADNRLSRCFPDCNKHGFMIWNLRDVFVSITGLGLIVQE